MNKSYDKEWSESTLKECEFRYNSIFGNDNSRICISYLIGYIESIKPEVEEFFLSLKTAKYSDEITLFVNQIEEYDEIFAIMLYRTINALFYEVRENFMESFHIGTKLESIIKIFVKSKTINSFLSIHKEAIKSNIGNSYFESKELALTLKERGYSHNFIKNYLNKFGYSSKNNKKWTYKNLVNDVLGME